MLTRFLALSAIWLIISSIVTFFLGTRVRHDNKLNGVLWLLTVILFGDLWALFTFGEPNEVLILSLVAALFGIVWIILLPNWNWFGQTTWTMSVLSAVLYIAYSFAVTAFTPLNPLSFLF